MYLFQEFQTEVLNFVTSNLQSILTDLDPNGGHEKVAEEKVLVDDELVLSEASAKEAFRQICFHIFRTMKKEQYVYILEQSKRLYLSVTVFVFAQK